MLYRFYAPHIYREGDEPELVGIIRSVEAESYDAAVERQVEEVTAKSGIRCVDDLLRSGTVWEVK